MLDVTALILAISLLLAFYQASTPTMLIFIGTGLIALAVVSLYFNFAGLNIFNASLFILAGASVMIGLAFVKIMLHRSVSLNALVSIADKQAGILSVNTSDKLLEKMHADIVLRLDHAEENKLITCNNDKIFLTRKGHLVADIVATLLRMIKR